VARHDDGQPFGVGSSADITQPALGTVTWTVDHLEVSPTFRSFAWTGRSRGITYTGRHEVEERPDGGSLLTLTIVARGGLSSLLAPLVRRTVQKTIEAEAMAFEQWARSCTESEVE
jgi:hypothetical protein